MDLAYEHLWAAGYDLPPETTPKTTPKPVVPRRGKKAAKAKKRRVKP